MDIDPSRLMGLTDGIFGMVMTLLVFGIALPELQIDSKNFLEKKPSKKEKRYVINTLIIIMGLTVIVNLLDFNVSGNFIYLFLLVPVITTIRYIMQYRNI